MNRLIACTLALPLVLLTPASANSAPTRLGGTGGSALTVDEGCPVTVTAEQLTFDVSGAGDSNGLTAQVKAVYQMENPTENPLSVQMSFYLEEHRGHMDSLVDVDSAVSSITADGQSLPFTIQEVETGDAAVDRFALTYTVEFPAWGTREVAVAYLSSSYGLREAPPTGRRNSPTCSPPPGTGRSLALWTSQFAPRSLYLTSSAPPSPFGRRKSGATPPTSTACPTGSSPSPSIHASPSPWPTGFTPY